MSYVTFAGQRACVEKIEFEIIIAPGADLFHQRRQPVERGGMGGIERVELFAPVETG